MGVPAEELERFVQEFQDYVDFVDQTRDQVLGVTNDMIEKRIFSGDLATRFQSAVVEFQRYELTPLHSDFFEDIMELRRIIEFVREIESRDVNF